MITKNLLDYLSSRMLDSYSFLRDYQSHVFTFINNKRKGFYLVRKIDYSTFSSDTNT